MSGHEEIKEALPGYMKNSLPIHTERVVEAHMAMCDDCRNELSLIALLYVDEVPDPGDAFWDTLPRKIVQERPLTERRGFMDYARALRILRPLHITAVAAVLLLAFFLSPNYRQKPAMPDTDYSYAYSGDPLTVLSLDYPTLTESDIPLMTDKDGLEGLMLEAKAYIQDSYYRDLVSLKAKELKSLDEAIDNQFMNGG